MKDLLFAINRSKKCKVGERNQVFNNMSVSELRRKLDEKGLVVDGSREVMIRALEANAGEDDDHASSAAAAAAAAMIISETTDNNVGISVQPTSIMNKNMYWI